MTCRYVTDAGPYVLGTLDGDDRERFDAHLPTCEECRQVLASVAGLPRLLALVPPDAVASGPPRPSEAMFSRLVDAAVEGRRRRRRRLALAIAAGVLVVAGAGGTAALLESRPTSGPQVVAGSAGQVDASVELRPAGTGTLLRLRLAGMPPGEHCRLVAVDSAGRRDPTPSWTTYAGPATWESVIATPVSRIAWLRVETDSGTVLAMPVPH